MKRIYESPSLELERFSFIDIITTSTGTGDAIDDNMGSGDGDNAGLDFQ